MSRTFGTLQGNLSQSDYIHIKNKRGQCLNTNPSGFVSGKIPTGFLNNPYLYPCKKIQTKGITAVSLINKYNLIMGQYTKMDLKDVCVISTGTPPTQPCDPNNPCDPCQTSDEVVINPEETNPFYWNATIDPLGELFGKTECGELNYKNYIVCFRAPPS